MTHVSGKNQSWTECMLSGEPCCGTSAEHDLRDEVDALRARVLDLCREGDKLGAENAKLRAEFEFISDKAATPSASTST